MNRTKRIRIITMADRTKYAMSKNSQSVNSAPPASNLDAVSEADMANLDKEKSSVNDVSLVQGQRFTLFPRLAPELRIRIWRFAIIPRFVG